MLHIRVTYVTLMDYPWINQVDLGRDRAGGQLKEM